MHHRRQRIRHHMHCIKHPLIDFIAYLPVSIRTTLSPLPDPSLDTEGQHTIHKIRQQNLPSSPLSVPICKDSRIQQRPAKCIGDYNHDSFCGGAVGWIRYIVLQSMDRLNVADMRAGVEGAGNAVFAGES